MAVVMIGVDPHKGSHTAVAIGSDEERLGQLRVRASASQAQRLVKWAAAWPERTWAVEGAGGRRQRRQRRHESRGSQRLHPPRGVRAVTPVHRGCGQHGASYRPDRENDT